MMSNAPHESRCESCNGVLVHSGAICVVCDDTGLYEAPVRTSPPLRLPKTTHLDALDLHGTRDMA